MFKRYHKQSGKIWRMENQLTIANKFISSTDNDKERLMHSKSDNKEIMTIDEVNKVIKELFDALKKKKTKIIQNQ